VKRKGFKRKSRGGEATPRGGRGLNKNEVKPKTYWRWQVSKERGGCLWKDLGEGKMKETPGKNNVGGHTDL